MIGSDGAEFDDLGRDPVFYIGNIVYLLYVERLRGVEAAAF